MHRLARSVFSISAICLFSLVLYVFSIYFRQPADLWIFSQLRAVTFLGLIFLSVSFLAAAVALRKKPAWEQSIDRLIQQVLEKDWLREGFLFLSGLILLVCLIPLFNLIINQDRRFEVIFLRYLWLIFLIAAVVIQTVFLTISRLRRDEWLLALFISCLLFCSGLFVQALILPRLEQAYEARHSQVVLYQLIWAVLVWAGSFWLIALPAGERKFWILILAMAAGFCALEWFSLPRKLWSLKADLTFYLPIFIFGLPLFAAFSLYAWKYLMKLTHGKVDWVAKGTLSGLLVLFAVLYYRGALEHSRTININTTFSDQNAYMNIIKTMRERNFHYTGDQNRMPGYPFLQALFYNSKMSDQELFEQGKRVNILLSLVLLFFLFLIFLKVLSYYQATLLLVIVAFSLYIFKAPYIQAEISFYFISFLSFVLMIQMLLKPHWLLGIATGVVVGLAYLTKGTILPAMALFAGIYLLKEIVALSQNLKAKDRSGGSQIGRRLIGLVLALLAFWVVIYPYASQMKQRFGNYFYNVNTTIYIWYDEMEQAYVGEAKYHFTEQPPQNIPADQVPGLRKYFREHTLQQAFDRFWVGVQSELGKIGWQFSITNYHLDYFMIFLLAIVLDLKNTLRTVKKYPYVIALALLFFLGYEAAFAWYTPIASGRRFTYGLYLPFLFSVFTAVNALGKNQILDQPREKAPISLPRFFTAANLIISFTLVYNIWVILTASLFYDRYGS